MRAVAAVVVPLAMMLLPSVPTSAMPHIAAGALHVAGDFDGDGLADVIRQWDQGNRGMRVEARKGTDGTLLWTKFVEQPLASSATSFTQTWRYGYAFPGKVRSGENGVVVAQYGSFQNRGSPLVSASATKLTAIAASGAVVWERTFLPPALAIAVPAGGLYVPVTSGNVWMMGLSDAVGGLADDPLVRITTGASVEYAALDGASGDVAWRAPVVPVTGDFSDSETTSDLSGDGRPDFFHATKHGSYSAHNGANGLLLWSANLAVAYGLDPLGDVTGDGVVDFHGRGSHAGFTVVDGATGSVLLTRAVGSVTRIGDIDGDGADEFGVRTGFGAYPSGSTQYEARRGDGSAVYSVTHTQASSSSRDPAGDLDADGLGDWVHVSWGPAPSIISGRDGSLLALQASAGRLEQPIGTSLDGDGDDFFHLPLLDASVGRAIDGHTGAVLWELPLVTGQARHEISALSTADLDGDGSPDVVLTYKNSQPGGTVTTVSQVVRGTDGAILWNG